MPHMTIYATQTDGDKWTLTDAAGAEVQEGYKYDTKDAAIDAAKQLWPANSTWAGRAVRNGWRIETETTAPEPRRKHAAGTKPDTSLYLGDKRRSWLIRQGGIQPTIQALIDKAMTN